MSREINEAILNDPQLKMLNIKLGEVYNSVSSRIILKKDGGIHTAFIDKIDHPRALQIKQLIKCRQSQIKEFIE